MELTDFLETRRNEYLKALNLMLNKMALQYETFVEPIEYKEHISNTRVEDLNYYRYDVFPKTGDDCYTEIIVNVNPIIFDKAKIYKFKDLELIVESFVWNACKVSFSNLSLDPLFFTSWFLKWINVYDDFMYKEFQNFIHGIVIKQENGEQVIIFDFGTASTQAITELFDRFLNFGITRIKIASNYE